MRCIVMYKLGNQYQFSNYNMFPSICKTLSIGPPLNLTHEIGTKLVAIKLFSQIARYDLCIFIIKNTKKFDQYEENKNF